MINKLTPRTRNWLFYNIKRFHAEDQYLKVLDSSIVISEFKETLNRHHFVNSLLDEIAKKKSFNKTFCFYRKDGNYFYYPSFYNQVKSLVECWEEIRDVYKNEYLIYPDEYDDIDDEPFVEVNNNREKKKPSRQVFGNKANTSSFPNLKEKVTIHSHLMSSNRYIKSSFTFEYNSFKRRCLSELDSSAGSKKNNLYFLQTDLKSFYHSLNPKTVRRILDENYHLPQTLKWLSIIEDQHPEQGLPIGWILSGLVSDLVMMAFVRSIEEYKADLIFSTDILDFEIITYVDDIVFFIKSECERKKVEVASKFIKCFQKRVSVFFEGSTVEVYGLDSIKVKLIHLSDQTKNLLKTNWHDIDLFTSISNDSLFNKNWTMLDEFLLPTDNDLFLNDKAQFFSNVRNLKAKVENDDFRSEKDFEPYLDKSIYKITVDKKYLQSVFDVFFLFIEKADDIKDKDKSIDRIWKKVKAIDSLNALDVIHFVRCYFKYVMNLVCAPDGFHDLINSISEFVQASEKFMETDDVILMSAFFKQVSVKKNIEIKTSVVNGDDFYFYETVDRFNELFSLYGSALEPNWRNLNPFLVAEVIREISKKQNINFDILVEYLERILLSLSRSNKKIFLIIFFDEIASDVVSLFGKEDLGNLSEYLGEYEVSSKLANEIESIVRNYESLDVFYSKTPASDFFCYMNSLNFTQMKTGYKRPRSLKFQILTASNSRLYHYYREILSNILFSMPTLRDALRFVLFQYRPIESIVFISWKALPSFFNGVSSIALFATKELLKIKAFDLISSTVKIGLDSFPLQKLRKTLDSDQISRITTIDLDFFDRNLGGADRGFKGPRIKLFVANLEVDVEKSFDNRDNFRFFSRAKIKVHREIMKALHTASKERCDVVCFPELTVPLSKLQTYLSYCGKNNLILVAGTEYYDLTLDRVVNPSVISFPTSTQVNPLNKSYHAYIQFKNFISIKEISEFKKYSPNLTIVEGKEIYVFKDKTVDNFSVLSCSDFLSLEIKYLLQGLVQTLYVPAMNFDNTTYHHAAQSAIRELYCICVICNNSFMGGSLVCHPHRSEWKRTLLRIEGSSYPKGHSLEISPKVITELQLLSFDREFHFEDHPRPLDSDSAVEVKDFKQPPPDWHEILNRKKIKSRGVKVKKNGGHWVVSYVVQFHQNTSFIIICHSERVARRIAYRIDQGYLESPAVNPSGFDDVTDKYPAYKKEGIRVFRPQ